MDVDSTYNQENHPGYTIGKAGNNLAEKNANLSRLVIDCGADTAKMGWAHPSLINPSRIAPNFVTRGKGAQNKLVAEEIENCRNFSGLFFRRPFDKGYMVNWPLQKQILRLEDTYHQFGRKFEAPKTDLLLTEPLFNPESIRKNIYEAVFEEYNFASLFNPASQMLALYDFQTNNPSATSNPCAVVVDSGYSFTHVVPFFDNTKITYAIKRINVGGKLLTNYLKETVSYRHWNMMNETYLINHIKERLCYVPLDFMKELEITKLGRSERNTVKRLYVLPDMVTNKLGYVKNYDPTPPMPEHMTEQRPEEQVLVMNNERLIPEVLFHPSDIGINQAGIAETIVQAVSETPQDIQGLLYNNIILMGGNTLFPGFTQRLTEELRQLVPDEYNINVQLLKDPILAPWRGGSKFAQRQDYELFTVSKAQYDEHGFLICKRRFDAL